MPATPLSLCVGDVLRLPGDAPLTPAPVAEVDDITVDFDAATRGLARVIAIEGERVTLRKWGREWHGNAAQLAGWRLGVRARWLAPERLGEWAMARHLRRLERGTGRALPWSLTRRLIAAQRGPLPTLERIGGRWRPWWLFHLRARLRETFRERGCYPIRSGNPDHGTLIDAIARPVRFFYGESERALCLDQIYLHPNGNLHLIGTGSDGRRRFRLDRMDELRLADGTALDPALLEHELLALTTAPGLPRNTAGWPPINTPAPPQGRFGRWFARIWPQFVAGLTGWLAPHLGEPPPPRPTPYTPRPVVMHMPEEVPHANYLHDAFWKRRLLRAIQQLAMGRKVRSNIFGTMQALLSDSTAARAGLTRLILAEADTIADAPAGDPATDEDVRATLREVAAAMPASGAPISGTARTAAAARVRRISARPDYRASRALNLAVACLVAAYRLDERDVTSDLPGNSAPSLRAFRRANALSGSDWHHGTFVMNRRAIPRLERLLALWGRRDPRPQATKRTLWPEPRLRQSVHAGDAHPRHVTPRIVPDPDYPDLDSWFEIAVDGAPPLTRILLEADYNSRSALTAWADALHNGALPQSVTLDVYGTNDPQRVTLYPTERAGVAALVIDTPPFAELADWRIPIIVLTDRAAFVAAMTAELARAIAARELRDLEDDCEDESEGEGEGEAPAPGGAGA